jgi:hypothetical protein
METGDSLDKMELMLLREASLSKQMAETRVAKRLNATRDSLFTHLHEVGYSGDLPLIVASERAIIEGDLSRYANSHSMTNSLKMVINEIAAIERHISIVDDPEKYRGVDRAHSLPRNRKGGLPFDEARQALASHYARLDNLDKSRLDDDEKKVIDARKSAIRMADRLYAERQTRTLGVETAAEKRGRRDLLQCRVSLDKGTME